MIFPSPSTFTSQHKGGLKLLLVKDGQFLQSKLTEGRESVFAAEPSQRGSAICHVFPRFSDMLSNLRQNGSL